MSSMEISLESQEQGLLRPVSDEAPAGVSVRLAASFETLEGLIKAADSLTAGSRPDWRVISAQAHAILREESKDLLVAAWWCLAVTHQHGSQGLSMALQVLLKLVTRYWELLYPEPRRLRARASALDWLMEKLGVWGQLQEFRPDDRPQLESAVQALEKLQEFCRERLAGQEPDVGTLLRALREHGKRLASSPAPAELVPEPAPDSKPAPDSTPTQASANTTAQSAGSPAPTVKLPDAQATLNDDKSIRDYLRQMQSASRVLVEALLKQDLNDPRPYQINRTMGWAAITQLPEARDGKTALRAVPPERRQLFQSLQEQGRPDVLIMELEKSFASAPFWLDCHFLVCQALETLDAHEAKQVVEHMLTGFLERFPALVQYRFADDTPFASEETRHWLASIQTGHANVAANAAVVSTSRNEAAEVTSSAEEDSGALVQEARQLVRSKAMPKAIALLQAHYRQGRTEAERFRRQLLAAEFCAEHKQPELARALLEDLDLRLQSLSVVQWEPELSVRVMELLLKVGEKGKGRSPASNLQEIYFNRLCLMDAARAVELGR